MKYKVCIIGLGDIGFAYDKNLPDKFILSHSRAIIRHNKFVLISGIDSSSKKRKNFSDFYGISSYSSIKEAIDKDSFDVFIISTSTKNHLQCLKEIAKYQKNKIILCEKPLSFSLDDADEMLKISNKNNFNLFVNYMRRSDPSTLSIKKMITTLDMQFPVKGTVFYSGGFFNNGSHFLNLLQMFFGKIKSYNLIKKKKKLNGDFDVDVLLSFNKAEMIFISIPYNKYSHYSMNIFSASGRLIYEEGGEDINWVSPRNDDIFQKYSSLNFYKRIDNDMDKYQFNVLNQLYFFMNNKPYSLCTGKEAYETIKIMHEICKESKNV